MRDGRSPARTGLQKAAIGENHLQVNQLSAGRAAHGRVPRHPSTNDAAQYAAEGRMLNRHANCLHVESASRHTCVKLAHDHPGLGRDRHVHLVDFEHAVESTRVQHDRLAGWLREEAGHREAAATNDHRGPGAVGDLEHLRDSSMLSGVTTIPGSISG